MASAQTRKQRRELAFALYERGNTIAKAAAALSVSFSTASRLRAEWKRVKRKTGSVAPHPYPGVTNLKGW